MHVSSFKVIIFLSHKDFWRFQFLRNQPNEKNCEYNKCMYSGRACAFAT